MKLRTEYTLSFLKHVPESFDKNLKMNLQDNTFELSEWNHSERRATVVIEVPVNRDTLSIKTDPIHLDGSAPEKGIAIPEKSDVGRFLSQIVHILSFLTDIPIRYAYKSGRASLIAENSEDTTFLESLGTKQIHEEFSVLISSRSFSLSSIDNTIFNALTKKEIGLALYAQALLVQEPIAAYRDFWKLLESAFGEKDDKLIQCLSDYPPAQELKFKSEELRQLNILRGRASHAESRLGVDEHRKVYSDISRRLLRLKCLAERVVLTKKTWGIKSLDIEVLASVKSYVNSDDVLVYINPKLSNENGN